MPRYCDSLSASTSFARRCSANIAASNRTGAAVSVRKICRDSVFCAADAPENGPCPAAAFQITSERRTSSNAALTPPVSKRAAAHRNSGSGA